MISSGCVFSILLGAVPLVLATSQPEVTIEQGVLRGLYKKTLGDRVYSSFEGIPYAKPPEGKHRFKEPLPPKPWLGIYNATREPPKCLQQNALKMFGENNEVAGSEDCLYINVYSPKLPTGVEGEKSLDVIAFIHGGAFMFFYSTFHDASLLLDRDVVLVTFNYRLGPLGFLSTEDEVVPGNNGLKDQVLALKWIQSNIAAFGGNPNSVTLAGMSAGGASCHLHLLSPLSKGLFKGAICMSGTSLNPWVITKNPKEKATALADGLGCPTNDTRLMVKCLRGRPAEHIVASIADFMKSEIISIPFGPVIEPISPDSFLSERPEVILQQKSGLDVPLLLSFAKNEGLCAGTVIVSDPNRFTNFINRWNEIMPAAVDLNPSVPFEKKLLISQKIKDHYKIDVSSEGAKNLIKEMGDFAFLLGIGAAAKIHASQQSSPVYLYQFSYRGKHSFTEFFTKEDLGVSHGDDTIYLFGFPLIERLSTESDIQVSRNLVDLWVSFAANGTLGENWSPVSQHLPKIAYTDIIGPNDLKPTVVDEIGEEKFWSSLMALASGHDEL